MKTIAKLTLAAAVAATISTQANAVAVSGTVTGMQLTLGSNDLLASPYAEFNGLSIGGDTVTGLTLTGDIVAYASGTRVGISFNLTNGMRQGANGSGGTIFEGGYMYVTTSTDGGSTYLPYDTVDASITNIPFLAGDDGHVLSFPNQTTAGLVVDDAGYGTLPGPWDLTFFGAGWNNSTGTLILFANNAGVFMEGSIAPVPVPAAAWLFGSGLLGLAGMRRVRHLTRLHWS